MQTNKENPSKPITKIPMPLNPAKAIPRHLLAKKTVQLRNPLRTIQQSNIPSSSHAQKNSEQKCEELNTLDTRYVTVRTKTQSLDWNYDVFKDLTKPNIAKDKEKVPSNAAVTPALKELEHKSIRNIKRSLKRPHSRELQGATPVGKQGKFYNKQGLDKFNESIGERLQGPDFWKRLYTNCLSVDYSDSIFDHLLAVEKRPLAVPRVSSINRACIINWLLKVNGPNGNPATVQSACWYMDSILGISQVHVYKLQLVAASCYWIAQKLLGPSMPATRLVKHAGNAFDAQMLMAGEKLVLRNLKFPAQPVVPQEFITYLSWCCDNQNPGEIEVAASFLCLVALMVDKEITQEFPSVIAAVAVRDALVFLKKDELLLELSSCPIYQAAERKTSNMSAVSSLIRKALRTVSASIYEYKTPLEYYDLPPYHIARKIISASSYEKLCK